MSESDSGKPPREFWLYDNGEEPFLAYYGLDDLKADTIARPDRIIHVIDKSAYDQLAVELAVMKAAKDIPTTNSNWPHEKKLHEELAEARAEIERLKIDCDSWKRAHKISSEAGGETITNRDQQIEIYEKALKFYANQDYYDGDRFTVDQDTAIDALDKAGKLKGKE